MNLMMKSKQLSMLGKLEQSPKVLVGFLEKLKKIPIKLGHESNKKKKTVLLRNWQEFFYVRFIPARDVTFIRYDNSLGSIK